jgi:hypothetical protein
VGGEYWGTKRVIVTREMVATLVTKRARAAEGVMVIKRVMVMKRMKRVMVETTALVTKRVTVKRVRVVKRGTPRLTSGDGDKSDGGIQE